jgi:hypothetical protein
MCDSSEATPEDKSARSTRVGEGAVVIDSKSSGKSSELEKETKGRGMQEIETVISAQLSEYAEVSVRPIAALMRPSTLVL